MKWVLREIPASSNDCDLFMPGVIHPIRYIVLKRNNDHLDKRRAEKNKIKESKLAKIEEAKMRLATVNEEIGRNSVAYYRKKYQRTNNNLFGT